MSAPVSGTSRQPLEGIRVLDLSRVLAGPLCTMMLGDLGANVVKVEKRGLGDETRAWGPPFDSRGESAYFLAVNRNKYSLAADMRDESDRRLVLALMQEADVVVENFLPGALQRVGIDRDALMQRNGRLIWCSITGFAPDSTRPGYDFVVQAEAGWMAITGQPDGAPMKAGVALADVVAGKDAAIAILAALVARERNAPVARRVNITLAGSARAALVNVAQNSLVSGQESRRWGNAHANLVPYQLFEASDRPIVIAVGNDDQWRALLDVVAISDLKQDPDLATNPGRLAQRARVVSLLQTALRERTAEDWLARLEAAGVPCGVVKTVLEAIDDAAGASPLLGMPPSMGGMARTPPPRLDEQGDLIRKAGWAAFHTPQ